MLFSARFDLVIFDCDGVLVDSELLANRVLAEAVTALGIDMDADEAMRTFRGLKMAECVRQIEARLGQTVPHTFLSDFRTRESDAFKRDLRPVDGITHVLENLSTPFCVASNGPREKIELSLGITGLRPHFSERIFSAYDVGCWKPDPGLFLHAATTLGVAPGRCVVVEDSVTGVTAAAAAGMCVFGYAAAQEDESSLSAAGATTFHTMRDLPNLLK